MADYEQLNAQIGSLIAGVPHKVANLANAAAAIFNAIEDVNWAGFYLVEDEKLVLGPFNGKPACIEIPLGKGVCGTAAANKKPLYVPDVHAFPGHIACDSDSRSEFVVPIFGKNGEVAAVLDIDSPRKQRFAPEELAGIEAIARTVERFAF